MGWMFLTGTCVAEDFDTAAEWLLTSAEEGNVEAQTLLIDMHLKGQGVPLDKIQAYKWAKLVFPGTDLRDQFIGVMSREEIDRAELLAKDWRPKESTIPAALWEPFE